MEKLRRDLRSQAEALEGLKVSVPTALQSVHSGPGAEVHWRNLKVNFVAFDRQFSCQFCKYLRFGL